jgi:hypothetical protein
LRTFCFFRREPSASGATGGRLGIRRMSMLDGYCLQQGAGVCFCLKAWLPLKVKIL